MLSNLLALSPLLALSLLQVRRVPIGEPVTVAV
jgi:hypothetical protein